MCWLTSSVVTVGTEQNIHTQYFMGPIPNPHLHSKYKAIVIGATGAVGRSVVEALLASSHCRVVTLLLRHTLDIEHDKLRQHIVGFNELR